MTAAAMALSNPFPISFSSHVFKLLYRAVVFHGHAFSKICLFGFFFFGVFCLQLCICIVYVSCPLKTHMVMDALELEL